MCRVKVKMHSHLLLFLRKFDVAMQRRHIYNKEITQEIKKYLSCLLHLYICLHLITFVNGHNGILSMCQVLA